MTTITQRLIQARSEIQRLEKAVAESASAAGEAFRAQSREGLLPSEKMDLAEKARRAFEEKSGYERLLHTARVSLRQAEADQQAAVQDALVSIYGEQVERLGAILCAFELMATRSGRPDSALSAAWRTFLPELGDTPASKWRSTDANRLPYPTLPSYTKDASALLDELLAQVEEHDEREAA